MVRFPVRLIFLALTFFLSAFVQTFANTAQQIFNFSEQSIVHGSTVNGGESFDAESIDLPATSHDNGKDLCLPLVERAEEQELDSKSFKKKTDRILKATSLSCALQVSSLFVINNKLSSLEWRDPFPSNYPRYLIFRNFRS
jgi:hypothetical protein